MVKRFLCKMKGRKTPDLDGLTGTIIKKLFHMAAGYILKIINMVFFEGIFAKQWKVAKVVILLKYPDKSKTSPRSYRPKCLL